LTCFHHVQSKEPRIPCGGLLKNAARLRISSVTMQIYNFTSAFFPTTIITVTEEGKRARFATPIWNGHGKLQNCANFKWNKDSAPGPTGWLMSLRSPGQFTPNLRTLATPPMNATSSMLWCDSTTLLTTDRRVGIINARWVTRVLCKLSHKFTDTDAFTAIGGNLSGNILNGGVYYGQLKTERNIYEHTINIGMGENRKVPLCQYVNTLALAPNSQIRCRPSDSQDPRPTQSHRPNHVCRKQFACAVATYIWQANTDTP